MRAGSLLSRAAEVQHANKGLTWQTWPEYGLGIPPGTLPSALAWPFQSLPLASAEVPSTDHPRAITKQTCDIFQPGHPNLAGQDLPNPRSTSPNTGPEPCWLEGTTPPQKVDNSCAPEIRGNLHMRRGCAAKATHLLVEIKLTGTLDQSVLAAGEESSQVGINP